MTVEPVGPEGVFAELLREERIYPPPEAFRQQAATTDPLLYQRAEADPEAFWEQEAEHLEWFRRWDRVLDWQPPHARWFINGKLNVAHNCLDRQIALGRRNKAAIIWGASRAIAGLSPTGTCAER